MKWKVVNKIRKIKLSFVFLLFFFTLFLIFTLLYKRCRDAIRTRELWCWYWLILTAVWCKNTAFKKDFRSFFFLNHRLQLRCHHLAAKSPINPSCLCKPSRWWNLQHVLRGSEPQKQLDDGRTSVPNGIMQRRVVSVAGSVQQGSTCN